MIKYEHDVQLERKMYNNIQQYIVLFMQHIFYLKVEVDTQIIDVAIWQMISLYYNMESVKDSCRVLNISR